MATIEPPVFEWRSNRAQETATRVSACMGSIRARESQGVTCSILDRIAISRATFFFLFCSLTGEDGENSTVAMQQR